MERTYPKPEPGKPHLLKSPPMILAFVFCAMFVGFGSLLYFNPQYDCNSPDFTWWKGVNYTTSTGVHHLPSCKETMQQEFDLAYIFIGFGLGLPILGAVVWRYCS